MAVVVDEPHVLVVLIAEADQGLELLPLIPCGDTGTVRKSRQPPAGHVRRAHGVVDLARGDPSPVRGICEKRRDADRAVTLAAEHDELDVARELAAETLPEAWLAPDERIHRLEAPR